MNAFNDLFTQPMTRREFLVHIALVGFIISGAASIFAALSDPQLAKNYRSQKQAHSGSAMGAGPYGR